VKSLEKVPMTSSIDLRKMYFDMADKIEDEDWDYVRVPSSRR
jgi:hypothetical protein